jgi:hypothetical protein
MNTPTSPPTDSKVTPGRPAADTLIGTPLLLLGLLTIAAFGGPIAIYWTIRGGAARGWPPDRPVEWWTFGLCTGAVVLLMAACLGVGLVRWRSLCRATSGPAGTPAPGGAGVGR